MKKFLLVPVFLITFWGCNNDDETNPNEITAPEGYTLIWNDEFDGDEINSSNWTYEVGDGTAYGLPPGWGNSELQIYSNSPNNSMVETDEKGNSVLAIVAEEDSPGNYTSAKLTTQDLQSFRFGRIEARIKLPKGKGIWPAFWALGDNITEIDWPGCGEIDILELIGDSPSTVYGTAHYTTANNTHGEEQGTFVLSSGSFSDEYHVFTLDWTPESLTYRVDDQLVNEVSVGSDMKEFLRSFYLILNIAVGGNWPGSPDASTVFPQKMYVDYIRVFSKDDFVPPAAPELVRDEEVLGAVLDASQAIKSGFTSFGEVEINSFGAGGEPALSLSNTALDGNQSVSLNYPGGNWGGAFFEMDNPADLSSFASGNLKFSIIKPEDLADAEVKLESVATNAAVFIANYTPVAVDNGFMEYTIPLSDFQGLDLTELRIPFAFWNPKEGSGDFAIAEVLVDNIHFE